MSVILTILFFGGLGFRLKGEALFNGEDILLGFIADCIGSLLWGICLCLGLGFAPGLLVWFGGTTVVMAVALIFPSYLSIRTTILLIGAFDAGCLLFVSR